MVMAYYRLGLYDDVRRSMETLMGFARRFRMDNPLVDRGANVYQPKEPVNLCYDSFGPPAAMIRGLFEYLYKADGLTLIPHIPPAITRLEQKFPIRFGARNLYITIEGSGPIENVRVNGTLWKHYDAESVFLPDEGTPAEVRIIIRRGGAASELLPERAEAPEAGTPPADNPFWTLPEWKPDAPNPPARFGAFYDRMVAAGLKESYEAAHAQTVMQAMAACHERKALQIAGRITPLPEPSETAANASYIETVQRLSDGLTAVLDGYEGAEDAHKQKVLALWKETASQ